MLGPTPYKAPKRAPKQPAPGLAARFPKPVKKGPVAPAAKQYAARSRRLYRETID